MLMLECAGKSILSNFPPQQFYVPILDLDLSYLSILSVNLKRDIIVTVYTAEYHWKAKA